MTVPARGSPSEPDVTDDADTAVALGGVYAYAEFPDPPCIE